MIHVALDLDGTISAIPSVFAALGKAICDDGNRVTVLTGALNNFPDSTRTVEGRLKQLESLGLFRWIHFTDVEVCVAKSGSEVAQLKRSYCQDNKVDLLIDDEPMYCNAANDVTNVAQFLRK